MSRLSKRQAIDAFVLGMASLYDHRWIDEDKAPTWLLVWAAIYIGAGIAVIPLTVWMIVH